MAARTPHLLSRYLDNRILEVGQTTCSARPGRTGRGVMALSLDAAAEVFREAMRDTVKRYSLWYLIQGALLIAAGILAIIYPVFSSTAVIVLLGWLLIISGVVQGLSLIGARHVPQFWLQLISVILAVLIGCLFLRDPAQGLVTIALLLIVFFMIEGISKVVSGGPGPPGKRRRSWPRPSRREPTSRKSGDTTASATACSSPGVGRSGEHVPALVSAYVYMIGQALEFIRMAAENGQASAQELSDAVRLTLLQAGTSGLVQPILLVMVLMEFSNAKLDPGADLQHLMANLFEQIGLEKGADASGGDFDSYLEDLAEEVGGDPFALQAQMLEMAAALPADHRTTTGISLLRTGEASAREAVVGWLLDPSAEVRHAVASAIEQAAPHGAVSGSMLRRLIALRNWLPETDRPWLDRAIQACRRKRVECAAWPQSQVHDALASGIDGVGAQSLFVLAREGRQRAIGCLLIKAEVGVRDAWARHGLTRSEMEEFVGQVASGTEVFPISSEYVRIAAAHALAVNLASGIMPPFGLLDFVETAELQGLQPEALPLERLLSMIETEADPGVPRSTAELLARSRAE